MINNQKEYIDRYDADQEAVSRGNFRLKCSTVLK